MSKLISSFHPNTGARDRAAVGVFTPRAAALFVVTGIGLFYYFQHEKQKLLEQRQKELESRSVGRAHVGGPFSLTTHDNTPFTEKDLLGKWSLVYFGFTNCPDICPAELDKIGAVLTSLEKDYGTIFRPVFISVDPARDSIPQMKRYLSDFHPRIIGLTGDYATVKSTCKAYRVYFSTPPDADPAGDYLVDHSIYVYLMDPRGEFVEAFGQSSTPEEVVERVRKEVAAYEQETGTKV
ncbi:SCO1 protein [Leucogyrophana mollusca]|uniref:SCO1 protein n=1 Tax=Leucogyrophana mollusca TaxID=85980 RepID=A0ACB8BXF3_9AGAM|nr:SCO1 protein [Leucogyrophana mollusca]